MSFAAEIRSGVLVLVLVAGGIPVHEVAAQTTPATPPGPSTRVVGVVRDDTNAIEGKHYVES